MPNIASIITTHNNQLLYPPEDQDNNTCNCKNKVNCPMNGNCLKSCIVYKAEVESVSGQKYYIGTSEDKFKTRYNNHTKSFRNRVYEMDTELSKHIWMLKDKEEEFTLKWSIAAKASPYKKSSKRCDLCISEKLLIAKADPKTLLNKRSEIISKCRHRNKFKLKRYR